MAAVTYWFPGPNSFPTLGQVSVPQAKAAMACAPPALSRWVTPARRATQSTSGEMDPSGRGGVARTIVRHPAIRAGTASMRAVEGSTAVPPGT